MPMPRADPAVAGGVAGAARGLRGARHHLPRRAGRARARPRHQGRPPGRRRRDAVRPVPRRPGAPRAAGRRGVRDDRRRLDPGRPVHARDARTPTCTRSATSRASARRRRACSPRARRRSWPTRSSPGPAAATRAEYDGRGICYLEFGDDEVAKVDVIFEPGQPPARRLPRAVGGLHGRQARVRLAAGSSGGSAATWPSLAATGVGRRGHRMRSVGHGAGCGACSRTSPGRPGRAGRRPSRRRGCRPRRR